MTAQPTPGPWTLQPIGDETECNILGAHRELIATVSDNDARLIAAAPRLKDELRALLEWVERETDGRDWPHERLEAARALLRDLHGDPS